jgi:flagellar FliL protein
MATQTPASKGILTTVIAVVVLAAAGFGAGVATRMSALPEAPKSTAAAEEPPAGEGGPSAAKKDTPSGDHGTGSGTAAEAESPAHEAADEPAAENWAKAVVTPLDPIITNISHPKGVWIRLEGSIVTSAELEGSPKALAAQAGQHIMSYLRTIRLEQIEGASGLLHLREDINEIMRTFSGGAVHQAIITGFIVE